MSLLFGLEREHLGKDPFLVPYYLGKLYHLDVKIITNGPRTHPLREFRGVKTALIRNMFYKSRYENLNQFVYLLYTIFHAKEIDVLMRFHLSEITMLTGIAYKLLNKKGFFYIKADGGDKFTNVDFNLRTIKFPKRIIKNTFFRLFLKSVDLITVETNLVYNQFLNKKMLGIGIGKKTRLMNNGFDEDLFSEYNIQIKDISEKENIIITVGRLGTIQKNTELILKAVEKINLKNWKIVLIGTIEQKECNFQTSIDAFFTLNPNLKNKVIFTGPINEKKELWDWYNRAKVFLLTSRYESWGLVLNEAARFRNYIVSTDVGGAGEMINNAYGEIIPQENAIYFSNILVKMTQENYLENQYNKINWENIDISWEKFIKDATAGIF